MIWLWTCLWNIKEVYWWRPQKCLMTRGVMTWLLLTPSAGAPSSRQVVGSMVDAAFYFSEFDEMNTRKCCGLIVKSGSSSCRGILVLGEVNPICKRGYRFFKKEKVSYTVNEFIVGNLRISHVFWNENTAFFSGILISKYFV